MIPSNPICPVCNYATNPTYCQLPSADQLQCGVVPLDSLPAAWWNAMWHETNQAVNQARGAVGALITEVNNVLQGAGVCVNPSCTDQLYQAIDKIRQTIGNASVAGAVKSSSCPGEVSIDANGIMTANCVGNAASLTTTARTVVGAVNELKQTYDCCFSDTDTAIGSKAPNMHASSATTYGVGNASCYGHLKISDEYTCCIGAASDGVAASQLSVYCVYDFAACIAAGVASLGNTAGCALGTAAAGTAVTAARSDHVHPYSDRLKEPNGCVVRFEGGNELNFYSAGAWINYRGGNSTINIGNGATNGGLGTLSAAGFCGPASQVYNNYANTNMSFYWSGQNGQPTWLWGSNDGVNNYVWNPSNFSVSYANSAGSASTASSAYCSCSAMYTSTSPGGSYLQLQIGASGDGFLSSGTHIYLSGAKQCSKTIYIPIW